MTFQLRHLAFGLSLVALPALAVAQPATTQTTPGQTTPGQTTPGQTTPGQAAPGMAAPTPPGSAMTAPSSTNHMSMGRTATGGSSMSSGSAGGVTHYASQSEASSACSGDTVVWASPRSKALHTSDSRYFGKSKHGFYACEKSAMAGGYHLAGTGKKHRTS